MAEIEFALLENGLDFIASGLRYISKAENKSNLKYGTLHLASGIELVLKARLERNDWRLLFIDPSEAEERTFGTGDFKSIDVATCFERLKEHCHISFEHKAKQKLQSFRARRNRFEHFRVVDTREAIESSAADALTILMSFIGQEFQASELSEVESGLLMEIRASLAEFARFTEENMRAITEQIETVKAGFGEIIECPCCLQEALQADAGVECLFCHYKDGAEEAADLYIANVLGESKYRAMKEGYDYPHFSCPNCDHYALVDQGISGGMNPAVQFVCFACGCTWLEGELEFCGTCGEPKSRKEIFAFRCRECEEAYLNSDHT